MQAGNYVQPGQTPISAVPTENYIIANFEEAQLEACAWVNLCGFGRRLPESAP